MPEWLFLCMLCVQSPHQGSRAPYQDCRLLSPPEWDGRWDFLIDICRLPMPVMVWKIDCPLFAPISNFPCKDCKIRIYNAFMLLNFSYCSIVCQFCSRQPVYKRERNTKQGIKSSFKWLSDIISRFTECSLSPNSVYGSRMKTIPTEMFQCMNNINPTS